MSKKIIIHIILFIIVQVLINMLVFIAFIPFVKADSTTVYVSADSFVLEASPDSNYGDNDNLMVQSQYSGGGYNDRTFLKFDLSGLSGGFTITSVTLKVYCNLVSQLLEGVTDVEAREVSDDSWTEMGITWNNQKEYSDLIDTQIPEAGVWIEWTVTDYVSGEYSGDKTVSFCLKCKIESYDTSARRSRHYSLNYDSGSTKAYLYIEYETVADNPPYYSNIDDNGITQVGEMVTCSSYWEDDFELDTCYIEHNATETPTNYSISVSGSSSWANKTFQLAFTKNVKVAYKFWCSDNASQWNSTSYYYITTTQLYVTFNLNNSTQGRFYIDLVNTANNTQNGYNYNQSIFLLGATYNSSYVWCNFTYSETIITENFNNYLTGGNDTVWCNFDVANITANGNGNGEYTETDLHEYFVLGAIISAVCVSISLVIIIDKKDLIRGK